MLAALGQSLVGKTGITQGIVSRHSEGQVIIDGEYWNCWADGEIGPGTKVGVKEVQGLALYVESTK